jgi:hypothetical protein
MATVPHVPRPSSEDPLARQLTLALRGFHWQEHAGVWQRGEVVLSDELIATLSAPTWEAFLAHLDTPVCPTCQRPWGHDLT